MESGLADGGMFAGGAKHIGKIGIGKKNGCAGTGYMSIGSAAAAGIGNADGVAGYP